jgi:hypothetical protein
MTPECLIILLTVGIVIEGILILRQYLKEDDEPNARNYY